MKTMRFVGPPRRFAVRLHCPDCGKRCYRNRKEAKRAARELFPGEALRAYQCGRWWHVGHIPQWVKRGHARPGRAPRGGEAA